jgi:hypothetical protein
MVFVEPWRGVTNSPDVAVGAVAGSLMIAAMIPYSPAPDKGRIKAMGRTSAGSSAIVVKRPQKTNNHIDDFTPPRDRFCMLKNMICISPGYRVAGVQKNETIDTEIALMTARSCFHA